MTAMRRRRFARLTLAIIVALVHLLPPPKNRVAHAFVLTSPSKPPSSSSLFAGPLPPTRLFDDHVYETIQQGHIAVIPEFLTRAEIAPLQLDAQRLWHDGHYATDALASYGTRGKFDPSQDRAVLKLAQWQNPTLGDYQATRKPMEARLEAVRQDLSTALDRPRLVQGASVTKYGAGSTEISYTRFGPGAFLARHVDEHHEELKGPAGWSKPTCRSLSWLVYLNDADWKADLHGGCLRCFQRPKPPVRPVGARRDGDLQIGWLRATPQDPVERPVFMDAQQRGDVSVQGGNCAMYIDDASTPDGIRYISNDFNANPTLFVAGSETLAQRLLLHGRSPELQARFHLIEPPKSAVTDFLRQTSDNNNSDEILLDVEPTGGTLVVFDSVSLPHQVMATVGRERWAASGWLHEDQQPVTTHPHFVQNYT